MNVFVCGKRHTEVRMSLSKKLNKIDLMSTLKLQNKRAIKKVYVFINTPNYPCNKDTCLISVKIWVL